jgi:metal-responsive CopG/Arc/MetJ family transcriptional regulator
MRRRNRILRLSIPSDLTEEFKGLARELGKSKSELFREMIAVYKARQDEEELYRVQRRISQQLNRAKLFTEKEIDRIIFEER